MKPLLGKLERIFLRKTWSHKALEFTSGPEDVASRMSAVFQSPIQGLN